MALGGLGALLLPSHTSLSFDNVISKVDFRSVFLAVVTTIIILVLAYLTNPSETSFRAYLTELSFKQHLSRLDDGSQDDNGSFDDPGVHFTPTRRSTLSAQKSRDNFDPTSPFHFVSRASVSLRTPKHVFRSFGILTIAAVYPTGRSTAQGNGHAIQCDNGSLVSDAWYIGAFGRWWRGGIIQTWWHEMLAASKDTERCGSGILDVKALDILEGFEGLPFPTSSRLPSDPTTKHRGTERPAHRATNNRSSTPPPLPKSASLPLHAPRVPVSPPPKVTVSQSLRSAPSPAPHNTTVPLEQPRPSVPPLAHSPSSSSLWDSSPIIAEVLRQISQSKAAVQELRVQLADFHSSALDAHATIEVELEAQRERKREEDAARAELKSRTKTLDDSKRSADSNKRDAEKRLRVAETARENAAARIERLGEEIGKLRSRMRDDEHVIVDCKEEGDVKEHITQEALEQKKKEIKVAEDVVAALNLRAKEFEERIVQEEERLRLAKDEADLKKQDRSFYPLTIGPSVAEQDMSIVVWSSRAQQTTPAELVHDSLTSLNLEAVERQGVLPQSIRAPPSLGSSSSGSGNNRAVPVSPRPASLSLASISNLREPANRGLPEFDLNGQVVLRPRGLSMFSSDLPSTVSSHTTSTRFSPFSDTDHARQDVPPPVEAPDQSHAVSPTSTLLIPSSLIQSFDGAAVDPGPRSFQSEDDAVLSRDWRKTAPFPLPLPVESPGTGTGVHATSHSLLTCPTFDGVDREDPFEVRPPLMHRRFTSDHMDLQRATIPSSRTISDPPFPKGLSGVIEETETIDNLKLGFAHRRWSSQHESGKERKGLNPEAKAFSLTKRSFPSLAPPAQTRPSPFDPLGLSAPSMYSSADTSGSLTTHSTLSIPSSLAHQEPDSLFSSISMRAFAPSRAEREALQRALGGSTNTSLERLPTLSEVSSVSAIPSLAPSPALSHAHAAPPGLGPTAARLGVEANKDARLGGKAFLGPSLAWLQSLPRVRKPKFSPWEDEETKELEAGGGL